MTHLKIKPISTNAMYVGRRWKSPAARQFEKDIALLLAVHAKEKPPDGDLAIHFRFGTTRRQDLSNCVKLVEDCIARHYGIDDRRFCAMTLVRVHVKSGGEFISFQIEEYVESDFQLIAKS